jgi:Ca2+-binding EF-hand superfamily protein
MVRGLYLFLLRLHPRAFRERFADEMLWIFEQESTSRRGFELLADACVSLFRQRVLRRRQEPSVIRFADAKQGQPAALMFLTLDTPPLRRTAFLNGTALAFLSFTLVTFAIGRGSVTSPRFLIGAEQPRRALISVNPSSLSEAKPTTEIIVKPPAAVHPLDQVAEVYFRIVQALGILDANQDYVISPWEIVTASPALRRLDRDHNGELTAEECGFLLGHADSSRLGPDLVREARLEFMKANPVLVALDADANGRVSAQEIRRSSSALTSLDRDRDGRLTLGEVLPELVDRRISLIFAALDTNRDGRINEHERAGVRTAELRKLLEAADRDRNGVVTFAEMIRELRSRDEAKRQLERAKSVSGFRDE